jgi:formylmethanofuran dehydrogenase subunit E
MSWRVVNDLNEIRQIVDENLPRIVRCNRCGEEFENGTSAELARHIMRCHRADLFSLA